MNIIYTTLTIAYFGTSPAMAAFGAATVLSASVSRFVQTGQLVEIVVPRYHKIKQEVGQQAAMSIIATLCNFMAGTALLLVICFILAGNQVVELLVPGFDAATKLNVLQIFTITGFLMPVQIATNLFQGMLNAENIYGKVELTNTVSLLVTVVILLIWGHGGNIMALVVGLIISVLAQFATTVYYLRQVNYKHSFALQNPYFPLRELFKSISATTAYMVGVQFFTFSFNAALSQMPGGVFVIYRYAEIIYGKTSNIFMMPISTVFFNEINRFITQNNGNLVRDFVIKNLNLSYFVVFVALLPFAAGGEYFIWTLWGGLKFNAHDVHEVYLLLCVFFGTMIFHGPYMIFRKLAVSVARPEIQYYLWAVGHVISGAMAYFLIHTFGFSGLMIQIFAHAFFMMLIPIFTVYWNKPEYLGLHNPVEIYKITISLLIGASVAWAASTIFGDFASYNKVSSVLVSVLMAFVALSAFLGSSLWLKVQELQQMRSKIEQFVGRVMG